MSSACAAPKPASQPIGHVLLPVERALTARQCGHVSVPAVVAVANVQRIAVAIRAQDSITRAGLVAQLAHRPEVQVVDIDDAASGGVDLCRVWLRRRRATGRVQALVEAERRGRIRRDFGGPSAVPTVDGCDPPSAWSLCQRVVERPP